MTMIAINTLSATRASACIAAVQAAGAPEADLDYVYTGAVGVGLNRLFDPSFAFVAADFDAPGSADDSIDVAVESADESRAASLATALSTTSALVLSAALCTGLEKLVGSSARIVGPFEV